MLFSLIWADSDVGFHTHATFESSRLETEGIWGLVYSAIISWAIGGFLYWHGRGADAKIYRKEAMAVVGLSWALATVLGALPYIFSGTSRGPSIRVLEDSHDLLVATSRLEFWKAWEKSAKVSDQEFAVLKVVTNASARGVNETNCRTATGISEAPEIFANLQQEQPWQELLLAPAQNPRAPADRASHFRIKWLPMGIVDAMFEAQSGFSTTGATVLCDLEDPNSGSALHPVLAIEYALSRWSGDYRSVRRVVGTRLGRQSVDARRNARPDLRQFKRANATHGLVVCGDLYRAEYCPGIDPGVPRHVGL